MVNNFINEQDECQAIFVLGVRVFEQLAPILPCSVESYIVNQPRFGLFEKSVQNVFVEIRLRASLAICFTGKSLAESGG